MFFPNNKKITNNDNCKEYNSDLFKLCDKIAEDLMSFYRQHTYTMLFLFCSSIDTPGQIPHSNMFNVRFSTFFSDVSYPMVTAYGYPDGYGSYTEMNLSKIILNYISQKTNGYYVSDYLTSLDLNEHAKNNLIQFNVSKFKQNEDIIKWCKQIFANGNPQRITISTSNIGTDYVTQYIRFDRDGYPQLDYVQLKALVDVIIEYSNYYYEIFSTESDKSFYVLRHIERANPKKW